MFRSSKQPPEDREVELCSTNKRKDSLKRDREEEEDDEEDEAVPLLGGAPKPARRWGSQGGAKKRQHRRPTHAPPPVAAPCAYASVEDAPGARRRPPARERNCQENRP